MSQYELNKSYEGSIKKYFPNKRFGFVSSTQLGDIFFHISRFVEPRNFIEVGEVVQFRLIYTKKYPGKLAATSLTLVPPSTKQLLLRVIPIDTDEKFVQVCNILNGEKSKSTFGETAIFAYQNSEPLYKLRLWIKKYVSEFDFELFKKYHFRLHRQEAADFRRYIKENIKESKRSDFRVLGKSILVSEEGECKIFETSWRDIGFENKRIFINIGEEESLLTSIPWSFARDDFNLIVTGYIARKDLKSIQSKLKANLIKEVTGLEQLQEAIKTIERSKARKTIDELLSEGWSPKQIREHPDFVTLGNEDLLRLFGNHECIDYLQMLQSTSLDMPLIYVVEKKPSTLGGFTHESSYLFSVMLPNNTIAVIWESVKLDRATEVFVCSGEKYFDIVNDIDEFLSSFERKKRSTLKSNTLEGMELRERLCYRTSVKL